MEKKQQLIYLSSIPAHITQESIKKQLQGFLPSGRKFNLLPIKVKSQLVELYHLKVEVHSRKDYETLMNQELMVGKAKL